MRFSMFVDAAVSDSENAIAPAAEASITRVTGFYHEGQLPGNEKNLQGTCRFGGEGFGSVKDFWIGYIPGAVAGAILIALYKLGVFG